MGARPIEDFRFRLCKALQIREMKPVRLVELTQIPMSSISQYMSGYANPKIDRIDKIAEALNINPAWLLGYDVPMEKDDIEKQAKVLADIARSPEMMKRIMAYMSLSDKDKKMLDSIVDAYIANAKTEQP